MHREPSIHIRHSDLAKILDKLLGEGINYNRLVKQIGLESKKYQLENRKLLVGTKKVTKKVEQLNESTYEITSLFNTLLVTLRKKRKHRNLTPIKEGSKDWLFMKEVSGLAYKFTQENNLITREGFIDYINLALDKMNKFTLYKIKSMHESLCEGLLAKEEIKADKSPRLTDELHTFYNGRVNERTGMNWDYRKIPEKYVYFIRGKEEAQRIGADPLKYLIAQFEGMEFRNGIPDPMQLIGPKALERYIKYAYEQGLGINEKTTENHIDFSKILKR